jgi:hypothetical protein
MSPLAFQQRYGVVEIRCGLYKPSAINDTSNVRQSYPYGIEWFRQNEDSEDVEMRPDDLM